MAVDADGRPLLVFGEQLRQRAQKRREEIFVEVDERDPARLAAIVVEAVLVGATLARVRRPRMHHNAAIAHEGLQHLG